VNQKFIHTDHRQRIIYVTLGSNHKAITNVASDWMKVHFWNFLSVRDSVILTVKWNNCYANIPGGMDCTHCTISFSWSMPINCLNSFSASFKHFHWFNKLSYFETIPGAPSLLKIALVAEIKEEQTETNNLVYRANEISSGKWEVSGLSPVWTQLLEETLYTLL